MSNIKTKIKFVSNLSRWFKEHNRNYLPWRKTNNPYKILIAELMLQKTTTKQVKQIYPIFIKKFPNIISLSEADSNTIRKIITPLGLENKRTHQFKKMAIQVRTDFNGEIPSDKKSLLSLTGVGEYISNAVLCLAFSEDTAMLDTNVIRVLTRVYDVKINKSRARKDVKLWKFFENMIPEGMARIINLGIIDLGAKVCLARKPMCLICPLSEICSFWANFQNES